MTTLTQDYAALPASADAAAQHARAVVGARFPTRAEDAAEAVRLLFLAAVPHAPEGGAVNVITTSGIDVIRFEVLDAGLPAEEAPTGVYSEISRRADRYGEGRSRNGGRMAYVEIFVGETE